MIAFGLNDKLMDYDATFEENRIDFAFLVYHLLYYVIICLSAVAALYPLWNGVAEGWVISSKRIFKNRIKSARLIKKRTDILCAANKIWRLQTSVKANFKTGIRFAEFLGFKNEGTDASLRSRQIRLFKNGENIFMSFFGNFAAARSAKAIGEYNNDLYQQQAAVSKAEAA